MEQEILNPCGDYRSIYKEKHKELATRYLDDLVTQSGVDEIANRETVAKYDHESSLHNAAFRSANRLNGVKIFLIILTCVLFVVGAIMIVVAAMAVPLTIWLLCTGICAVVLGIIPIPIIIAVLNPKIKAYRKDVAYHSDLASKYLQEAWGQAAPLNRLFELDIATHLIEETNPIFDFDDYLDTRSVSLLGDKYGLGTRLGDDHSILNLKSGRLAGSPFVIAKILSHQLGIRTWTGSITISWTTSNGKGGYVSHSQTLTASINRPCPYYNTATKVIFGSEAAPDLSFSRSPSSSDGKTDIAIDKMIAKKSKKLEKEAVKAGNNNYTQMSNPDFEVLFNALDRDHPVQFRLLFTPLAQAEMVKVIKDDEVGYGDDFYFDKIKMLNIVTPKHLDAFDLSGHADNYTSYSIDKIKTVFVTYQMEYFRQFYYSMAPILAIPIYQQYKPSEYLYKDLYQAYLSDWQHETVANLLDSHDLVHPDSITKNVIKTRFVKRDEDGDQFETLAYGYRGVNHVHYETVWGGDGRSHQVPIHWTEYIQVRKANNVICKLNDSKNIAKMHTSQIRDRIMSYMNEKQIQTFGNYFAPGLCAFVVGKEALRVSDLKMKDVLK